MKRERIQFRASMAGSSDVRRLRAAQNILVENHEKNVSFFNAIKAEKKEESTITESLLLSRYSEVQVWETWKPITNYIGMLVFMYNSNFKFK